MLHLPWLEQTDFCFPKVNTALIEPDGLLAASNLLNPTLVVQAYGQGIFPWYSEGQPVLWWSPNPRCVLYPKNFHVSRRFKTYLKNTPYDIKVNSQFSQVMLACAAPRANKNQQEDGTWITDKMQQVYTQLHKMGIAHSIECWHQQQLVGGIYGLILGDVFFGESMFSKKTNASKIAMHYLCTKIKPYLIDAQVYSPHLARLGASNISRDKFITLIAQRKNKTLIV